jgi:signal transduction histidine kinase/DNA-binding response OmpR family regulator
MSTTEPIPATFAPNSTNLLWLRTNTLHRLAAVAVLTGIIWLGYIGLILEQVDLFLWSGPLCLIGFGLMAYRIIDRWGFSAAVSVYVAGLVLGILLGTWAHGDPWLLLFVTFPAGIISLLVGPRTGFVAALMTMAAVGAAMLLFPAVLIPPDVARLTGVLIFLTAVLLWIATYPLRMTIHWAWAGYEQARLQTKQTQEHRAQLMQTVKELDAAYERLKVMAAELERARQTANAARRLKAEFAANISHELRTPLNLIIGFTEMMALAPETYGETLPDIYQADVEAIYRNARHLSNLIDDVLDLSQIEAGRMGLVKQPLRLAEVIEEAIATVALLYETKKLTLTVSLPDGLPPVEADRTRLRQVLINLLNNAVRFTHRGGVTVSVAVEKNDLAVNVTDTGIGIAAGDLTHVFEEFRQLNGSAPAAHGGSGLGLAVSKKFVELHGGRMWATSQLDQGTTFSFSLPRQPHMRLSQQVPEWETWVRLNPEKEGHKTIVVVDAEQATAKFFERYLDGYRVLPVQDVAQVRRLATEQPIHAVVVVAPTGESGWLQLRGVREGLPNLPVAVCTLRGGVETKQLAGVTTYLVKPVSQARFLAALARLGDEVKTLLLVDDSPEVVHLLSRMVSLAPRPYRLLQAYSGAQALSILHQDRPDAIILDLLMPEVDGYTVLEHLQANEALRRLPVIVVSARGMEEEVITAGLVGITRREGFSVGEMMRCLQAGLDALRPVGLTYTAPTPSTASAD